MKVKDILIKWLKDNGYDGLYCDGECGCLISNFCPCGSECVLDCEPGVKIKSTSAEFDFMITAKN